MLHLPRLVISLVLGYQRSNSHVPQSFCGMSVVDGPEFEALKRYNVNEIYRLAFEDLAAKEEEAKEKSDS